DDEGYHVEGGCAIGMRRLSIIDLSTGHQPMANEDESIWVVFNGEIYNYRELRRDLLARGHRFATNSDTETLVHLYEEQGAEGLRRLRGMFAYAIWDARRRRIFLARDRFGKKPLYYAVLPGGPQASGGVLADLRRGRHRSPRPLLAVPYAGCRDAGGLLRGQRVRPVTGEV